MEIDSEVLVGCLKPYVLSSTIKRQKINISNISFIGKNTPLDNEEVLYIGYASDLPVSISAEREICLICLENCKIPSLHLENSNINMIVLDPVPKPTEIYNAVNALLRNEHLLKYTTERLFQSIIKGFSIQEICEIGYELLQNPVAILDNSLKHIAYTSDAEVDDAVWIEIKKNNGYVSNESMLLFSSQNEFKEDFNLANPFIMSKGKFKYRRMVSHIFVNQEAVGTMIVIESENPFRDIDTQMAAMITKVLSLEMKKSSFIIYSKGLAYEHFFKDLLDGMHDETLISEKLKTLNLQIKEDLFVLTIDISEFDQTYKTLLYFREALDQMIFSCKSIIYNDSIILIIMRSGDYVLSENELKELNNFFEKNNLYGGISKCFHNIIGIRDHVNQAVAAATLSRRIKKVDRISYYEDYTIYHLIDIAAQQVDLRSLCSEPLMKLIDYDRQNNTPYALNLYHYLINERNLAHTAIALHTHRNTLIYRLNRIKEIIQVNLEDSDVRLNLLLTYKIMNLL